MPASKGLKNLIALLLGVFIAFAGLALVDSCFRWYMHIPLQGILFFPRADVPDGLGWVAWVPPSGEVRHKKMVGGEVVFDVNYHFDGLYRRITPFQPQQAVERFVVFFGGSNTFGEGLTDEQAIPALVQREAQSFMVYNYAYMGYGPNQMLAKLESGSLPKEVREPRGIAIYQYLDVHIPRVIGSMSVVRWAGGRHPYYFVNAQGELEHDGTFATGRFWTTALYWLLGKSAILEYLKVELPPRLRPEHYDLACRVVKRSRDLFLGQFPGSRFVVVVGLTSGRHDPFVASCLEAGAFEYLDMRPEYDGDPGWTYPRDGHLTAKSARLTAEKILPLLD